MISVVRLRDGTEIVGDVIHVDEESAIINNPLQINYKITIMQPAPSMGLSRFMPFAKGEDFEFPIATIGNMMEAKNSLATYYRHALDTYITELDVRIDDELIKSASEESQSINDLYAQLLEKVEPTGQLQ